MRRVAIALLFALILLAPFVSAEAQQPPIYWLGYLSSSGSGPNPFVDQFVQVDGQATRATDRECMPWDIAEVGPR